MKSHVAPRGSTSCKYHIDRCMHKTMLSSDEAAVGIDRFMHYSSYDLLTTTGHTGRKKTRETGFYMLD